MSDLEVEDDELFLQELPDYLRCPICLSCLENPYQTPCGHRFCKDCILPLVNSVNNFCPQDRSVIDSSSIFPDNAVKLQINNLKIRCPKSRLGCTWEGELWDKGNHLQRCKHASSECEHCRTRLLNAELKAHVAECPRRSVKCEYCDAEVVFEELSLHHTTCRYYPVPCVYKCQTVPIPRQDVDKHLKNDCPRAPLPCSMAAFGCTEQVERANLGEHVLVCGPKHAASMGKVILELRDEVERLKVSVNSQTEAVRAMESTVYPCFGQFTWKVEDIVARIKEARRGDASSTVIYSPPFFSTEAGYKLCLCIYPAGDNNRDYLSLYFVVMNGPFDEVLPWPFQKRVYMALLNCKPGGQPVFKDIVPDPRLHYFHKPENPRNVGYGYPKFIALSRLLSDDAEFVAKGAIFFRCIVFN